MIEKNLSSYSEWAWRIIILAVLAGQLWVSSKFVSVEQFQKANDKWEFIKDKVIVIEETVKRVDRYDIMISSLNERVRLLEIKNANPSKQQ